MATLILEVEDRKVRFLKKMLKHFAFVKIQEPDEDTDEEVIANIRAGVKEMRQIEQGKLKATSFDDYLKELDEL